MLKDWIKAIDKRAVQYAMQNQGVSKTSDLVPVEMGKIKSLDLTTASAVIADGTRPTQELVSSQTPSLDQIIKASESNTILADSDYATVRAQHEHAVKLLGSLLGIERSSAGKIEQAIQKLGVALRYYEFKAAGEKFLPMQLDGFKWRHKNGNPKLAIFSLDDPTFSIGAYQTSNRIIYDNSGNQVRYFSNPSGIWPKLPTPILNCYVDVLRSLRGRHMHTTLTATFSGVIPQDIKDTIHRVRGQFDALYIVAEPDGFELKETAMVPEGDPLLVGWIDNPASLWLIADFDTTPVEEAMMIAR